MSETEKSTLLQVGLTTGQTLRMLTKEPIEKDLDLMIISSEHGDVVEIRKEFVTYVRACEVDTPTEEELLEYIKEAKGKPEAFEDPFSAGNYI